MKSATILIKTDPQLKLQAQKLAEKCGVSLSSVLSRALQVFVRDRAVTFSADDAPVPNAKTGAILRAQVRDMKSKKKISPTFSSKSAAIAHLRAVCK